MAQNQVFADLVGIEKLAIHPLFRSTKGARRGILASQVNRVFAKTPSPALPRKFIII